MDHNHSPNDLEIEEEKRHFSQVVTAFRDYAKYAFAANDRRRKDIHTLSKDDRLLLEFTGYKQKLQAIDAAISENNNFLAQVVANPEMFGEEMTTVAEQVQHSHTHDDQNFHESHSHSHASSNKWSRPTDGDMDKLRSTLKQLVRDWSAEGEKERETSYKPMKDALLVHFSGIPSEERGNIRVLVPGAGLGRLAFDVAQLGFTCQGNEFSHYMLLTSFFILNRTDSIEKYKIYPYIHSLSNLRSKDDILRPISIPDVLPVPPPGSDFSLVAGDFEEIYGANEEAGQWNAILTCFFIDTAKNIVNYLRIIHRILAPGGVWINLGPLLWHWENNTTNDPSIELSLDEVKALARAVGFEISNEKTMDATYVSNSESMLNYVYHVEFWTATKVE